MSSMNIIISQLHVLPWLQSFTARISQEHLTQFNCKDDFDDMLKGVVGRVLEVYVRHVCMLRPLTDGGKMKITSDMAQVQYNIHVCVYGRTHQCGHF